MKKLYSTLFAFALAASLSAVTHVYAEGDNPIPPNPPVTDTDDVDEIPAEIPADTPDRPTPTPAEIENIPSATNPITEDVVTDDRDVELDLNANANKLPVGEDGQPSLIAQPTAEEKDVPVLTKEETAAKVAKEDEARLEAIAASKKPAEEKVEEKTEEPNEVEEGVEANLDEHKDELPKDEAGNPSLVAKVTEEEKNDPKVDTEVKNEDGSVKEVAKETTEEVNESDKAVEEAKPVVEKKDDDSEVVADLDEHMDELPKDADGNLVTEAPIAEDEKDIPVIKEEDIPARDQELAEMNKKLEEEKKDEVLVDEDPKIDADLDAHVDELPKDENGNPSIVAEPTEEEKNDPKVNTNVVVDKTAEELAAEKNSEGSFIGLDEHGHEVEMSVVTAMHGETAVFGSTNAMQDFESVYVDGKKVSEDDYTVVEGSTIVRLTEHFVKTLAEGEHEVRMIFKNSYTFGKLVVKPAVSVESTNVVEKTEAVVVVPATTKKVAAKEYNPKSNYIGEVQGAKFNEVTGQYEALEGFAWNDEKQMFVRTNGVVGKSNIPSTKDESNMMTYVTLFLAGLGVAVVSVLKKEVFE